MNKPEWTSIVVGCIAAIVNGALEPTAAIVQTKLVTVEEFACLKILFHTRIFVRLKGF